MMINSWRVLKCQKCGKKDGIYYAPPLSTTEPLRSYEIEEYESNFEVKVTENGKFERECDCGEKMVEAELSEWPLSYIKEVIGNMMEDDNHHSLTGLGHIFDECMEKAGISDEQRAAALIAYMKQYDETGYICGYH